MQRHYLWTEVELSDKKYKEIVKTLLCQNKAQQESSTRGKYGQKVTILIVTLFYYADRFLT